MLSWTFHQFAGLLPRPSGSKVPAQPVAPGACEPSDLTSPLASNPRLAARRAEALRSMFPKLSSWFSSRYDSLCINEINEYLSQASNVTDLEQRIRLIEQQRHFS